MTASSRSRPLALLVTATMMIAIAYASAFGDGGAPGWAAWSMAVGCSTAIVALMILGVMRPGKPLGALRWVFVAVFVLVTGAFHAMLAIPPAADRLLVLGIPLRAAIVLIGVGLVPLFLVPLAYALTFDRVTLSEEELARIRAEALRLRRENDVPRTE